MIKKFTPITFATFLIIFLLLAITPPCKAAGHNIEKLAILPFSVNASSDLSYLSNGIRDMLASRLASGAGVQIISKSQVDNITSSQPSSVADFTNLAQQLDADYLVTGSYTSLGESGSLDAKVFALSTRSYHDFFANSTDKNSVIMAINNLAWDIGEKIFGKAKPAQAAPVSLQTAPRPSSSLTATGTPVTNPRLNYASAHPERAYISAGSEYGSAFIRPESIAGAFGFTKSQNFTLNMQSFDVGDIDGDGLDEVVIAGPQSVRVYAVFEGKFGLLTEVKTSARYKINYLSMADVDGDGKAEIYVSSHYLNEPSSSALVWRDNSLQYIFENAKYHIRAMNVPGEGLVLAGQRGGIDFPFEAGIYIMKRQGDTINHTQSIFAPTSVNIFDFTFADLESDGRTEVVSIDQNDRIRVMTQNGKQKWLSSDYFGGTKRYVGKEEMKDVREDLAENQERVFIPSRLIATDLNNDGKDDIIVNKNLSSASRVVRNLRSYPSGEIFGMGWNGISLAEIWHTQKIDGYIVDYQIRSVDDKGKVILYVGVILNSGVMDIFSENQCTVLMYQLDLSPAEGTAVIP